MRQFLVLALPLMLSFPARADQFTARPWLNQFGAQPAPARGTTAFAQMTEFLRGARKGGTLRLAHHEPMVSIFPSPIRHGDFRPRAPLSSDFIYETLMTQDPRQDDYTLHPLSVAELRTSADFCKLQVRLRDDVRFSDGHPLTTRDVRFSLDQHVNEFFSGALAQLVHRVAGKILLHEVDSTRFEVEFTEIEASGCRQAAFYFLNGVHLIKPNPSGPPSAEVDMPFLGTGPYRVAHAERSLMRLERNPEYWARAHRMRRQLFNPDLIEVRVFMDPLLERFALLRGEVNLMRETHFNYDDWMKKQIARRPLRRLDQESDGLATETGAVWMNQSHQHTGNIDFRRALLLAWDLARPNHDFFADRRHALKAPGSDSPLYPRGRPSPAALRLLAPAREDQNYASALGPIETLDYERLSKPAGTRQRLRLALAWLNHAGYTYARKGGRTVLTKDGRPVRITALINMGSPELKLFLRFQNELRRIGIELELKELGDRSALVAALQANQYDLYAGSLSLGRNFSVINSSYLIMELHSSMADGLGAWGRVRSKMIDLAIDTLEKLSPAAAQYPAAVEVFVRALNANLPMLPSGELDPVVTYHHQDLKVWGRRDRDLWTLYFEPGS